MTGSGHAGQGPEREILVSAQGDASAEVLAGLFEEAPVGIALLDPDLYVVRANAALARIAGRAAEQLRGLPVWEALPGVFGRRFDAGSRKVLAGGGAVTDLHLVLGEGEGQRHLSLACYPVHAGGRLAGVGVTLADVTERRRSEELTARLLAIAGHDLKTPLAAVALSTQALLRSGLDPRQERLVRGVASSAARVEGIVKDLVDYAVTRRGKGIPIRPSFTRLDAICRAVTEECQAANPGREISCDGEGAPEGEWDADRLAQAVSNLVTNALKYGDAAAPVEVRWAQRDGEAWVRVRNTGPPIAPDVLPRLFEPFQRGPDEQRARGLGLGLFIAREIATAHGGRLEAASGAEGTVFALVVPTRALH